jgi:hypothetical protein
MNVSDESWLQRELLADAVVNKEYRKGGKRLPVGFTQFEEYRMSCKEQCERRRLLLVDNKRNQASSDKQMRPQRPE